MRRATSAGKWYLVQRDISIHTLHAEGDVLYPKLPSKIGISIHTLHAEGDQDDTAATLATDEFQSTPSMRRATLTMPLAFVL